MGSFFTEQEQAALRVARPHLFGVNNLENLTEQELRHRNLYASAARPNNGITFLTDHTRREAGIAFRVSDHQDGRRYGYQVVHGRKFAYDPSDDTPEAYFEDLISTKIEYDRNQTSKMPMRETNLFLTIDTNIAAQKGGGSLGGTREQNLRSEIERRDVGEIAQIASILDKTIHNLLNEKDEILNWLNPIEVDKWGDTVKNRITAQKEAALIPWGMSHAQLAEHNITSRHKAVQFIGKNPGAFRMPKTTNLNNEVLHQLFTNTDQFFKDYIITIQYHTNVGIRKSYRYNTVYTLCANTQVLIQHFMKFQVNIDYWRQEISREIQRFFTGNSNMGRVDPARQKQIFIRYKMIDNSGFEGFQQWYIAKNANVNANHNRNLDAPPPAPEEQEEPDNGFNPDSSDEEPSPPRAPPPSNIVRRNRAIEAINRAQGSRRPVLGPVVIGSSRSGRNIFRNRQFDDYVQPSAKRRR